MEASRFSWRQRASASRARRCGALLSPLNPTTGPMAFKGRVQAGLATGSQPGRRPRGQTGVVRAAARPGTGEATTPFRPPHGFRCLVSGVLTKVLSWLSDSLGAGVAGDPRVAVPRLHPWVWVPSLTVQPGPAGKPLQELRAGSSWCSPNLHRLLSHWASPTSEWSASTTFPATNSTSSRERSLPGSCQMHAAHDRTSETD